MGVLARTRIGREGRVYYFHPDHRNGNRNKSQWTVNRTAEFGIFIESEDRSWGDGSASYWGLLVREGRIEYLGTCVTGRQLNIAHFVSHNAQDWHGYPANPRRNTRDAPIEPVRRAWLSTGLITKAQANRLKRRLICSL